MENGSYDVFLGRCPDYTAANLDSILENAAENARFPDIRGMRVLIKPNLLSASPAEKAVTTNPEFLAAVIRLLKAKGAKELLIGDSPAWQTGAAAAKASGIGQVAKEYGCRWLDFKEGAARNSPNASLVPNFVLTTALDLCDIVINLPKLKTHAFMCYTGAIKNFFGLMPGLAKSSMHLRFRDKNRFGAMLVDLYRSLPKSFTFMDGIVAMEGPGPGSGTPYPLGLVLAAEEPAALDWVALQCIGYRPREIGYVCDAVARTGREPEAPGYRVGPEKIDKVAAKNFKLIPVETSALSSISKAPGLVQNLIGKISVSRPKFDPRRCIGCLACVKVCPNGALSLKKNKGGKNQIRIDDSACIQCFCCHEVCPEKAIAVSRVYLRKPSAKWKKAPAAPEVVSP